ncbi:unnamed protein product [Prorocentrum cordatum]|uniref:Uncharacterized protein n=1 Tax=Prorocentrum cordatum TaxID=2364126 RepID=A0ABN9V5E9_9DINO|nr:unnamed protein product [Polarella glacialis]
MEEAAGQSPESARPGRRRSLWELAEVRQRARESCEYQLWQSCGRQVPSTRRTMGCPSAFGRSQVVPQSRLFPWRCEVTWPEVRVARPSRGTALRGRQRLWRLATLPQGPSGELQPQRVAVLHGVSVPGLEPPTTAPPSPSTEVSSPRSPRESAQSQQPTPRSRRAPLGAPRLTWEEQERRRRRQGQAPDHNALSLRYPAQPAYSFASKTNRGVRLFRDLRGSLPLEGWPRQRADVAKQSL